MKIAAFLQRCVKIAAFLQRCVAACGTSLKAAARYAVLLGADQRRQAGRKERAEQARDDRDGGQPPERG